MSNYDSHAKQEFRAAGWTDEHGEFKDDMQEMICMHVLKLLELFHDEGHSGTSAPYAINLFSKLAKFEPITPLTGEDWEWNNVSEYHVTPAPSYQNKRCSHVFKDSNRFDGQAYDINGKVFWEWYKSDIDGEMVKSYYTSKDSSVPITFPYSPVVEYVFVPTKDYPNEAL